MTRTSFRHCGGKQQQQQQHQSEYRGGTKKNKNITSKAISSSPWVTEIQKATSCCVMGSTGNDDATNTTTKDNNNNKTKIEQVDHSLSYLKSLDDILYAGGNWDRPPVTSPPMFRPQQQQQQQQQTPPLPSPPQQQQQINGRNTTSHGKKKSTSRSFGQNRFEMIASTSSDEEDDDTDTDTDTDDEAGDQPVLSPDAKPFVPRELCKLRLLIRVYTSQADLYSKKARLFAVDRQWLAGAASLQSAIASLTRALEIADSEISKCLMVEVAGAGQFLSVMDTDFVRRKNQLQQDADIVHVSTQNVFQEHKRYLQTANRHAERLRRRLLPLYESREEVKKRMGDRWTDNPNPSNKFARERQKNEAELEVLEEALEQLTKGDTRFLSEATELIKYRLQELHHAKNRYNGIRPNKTEDRLEGYPIPEDFGWTFTGSSDDRVEFYEKQFMEEFPSSSDDTTTAGHVIVTVVTMKFFFTTGIVNTVLEHPVHGTRQLLSKKDSKDLFHEVLKNPDLYYNDPSSLPRDRYTGSPNGRQKRNNGKKHGGEYHQARRSM
jgi:hypothetical protein